MLLPRAAWISKPGDDRDFSRVRVQIASYQHVVVVMSIVLGLSLTQLLKGLAQIYRMRTRVRPYWLHTAWVVFLIFFSLLLWWLFWNYRTIEQWNFVRFVLYLSPMILF